MANKSRIVAGIMHRSCAAVPGGAMADLPARGGERTHRHGESYDLGDRRAVRRAARERVLVMADEGCR